MVMNFMGILFKVLLSLEKDKETDSDVAVAESQSDLEPPSQYQVVLMNDDFTTMDFVIDVLERFFSMPQEKATQVMLAVHKQGRAVCGIYSKDVAETKVEQVNRYAREHGHPLLCTTAKMD